MAKPAEGKRCRQPTPRIVNSGAVMRAKGFPFGVAGLYQAGKRVRKWFRTKEEAEAFLRAEVERQNHLGSLAAHMSPALAVAALEGEALLKPWGKSILDAARFYVRHLEASGRSITVAEAVEELLKAKKADGRGERFLADIRSRLGRFAKDFGGRLASTIEQREIADWLRAIPVSPQTRANFHRYLHLFFAYCVRNGYAPANPAAGLDKPKVILGRPSIYSPAELLALLETAAQNDGALVPFIALCGFAGLRTAEALRLDWRDVSGRYVHLV